VTPHTVVAYPPRAQAARAQRHFLLRTVLLRMACGAAACVWSPAAPHAIYLHSCVAPLSPPLVSLSTYLFVTPSAERVTRRRERWEERRGMVHRCGKVEACWGRRVTPVGTGAAANLKLAASRFLHANGCSYTGTCNTPVCVTLCDTDRVRVYQCIPIDEQTDDENERPPGRACSCCTFCVAGAPWARRGGLVVRAAIRATLISIEAFV